MPAIVKVDISKVQTFIRQCNYTSISNLVAVPEVDVHSSYPAWLEVDPWSGDILTFKSFFN